MHTCTSASVTQTEIHTYLLGGAVQSAWSCAAGAVWRMPTGSTGFTMPGLWKAHEKPGAVLPSSCGSCSYSVETRLAKAG